MKEMIYYPGFEVSDPTWLKFALLYLDSLHPIIPRAGDKYLGDLHRRVAEETDLIRPHRPEYTDAYCASLDAADAVEDILRRPERYAGLFGRRNVPEIWRERRNQQFVIFRDKFTAPWEDLVRTNGLGCLSNEGLMVPKELGLIFMTILAQAISDAAEMPAITDSPKLDSLSVVTRQNRGRFGGETRIAQAVTKLLVPADLAQIDFDQIINLRNRKDFRNMLRAFHSEFSKWVQDVEDGKARGDFTSTRGTIWRDFRDAVMSIGTGAASVFFGTWLLTQSVPADWGAYVKELVAASGVTVGAVIAVRDVWEHTKNKRFTRKYVASLKRLQVK